MWPIAIIEAAGWPIWSIIAASIASVAIILERLFSLRKRVVLPPGLLEQTLQRYREEGASTNLQTHLQQHSLLGQLFSAGLRHIDYNREVMKEAIEDQGRVVAYQLERFLTTLGTIAAMAPLLGLLGTVIGMIEIFGAQAGTTSANPQALAHGISVALYNTAFGLIVAIPSMMFYRYFRSKVNGLLVEMESQAIKLVEMLQSERRGED